ncbi:MAG: UDP-N-acetylmuramoyl-L-alanine--D-glutamate ligase [Bacteroidota bacterium]
MKKLAVLGAGESGVGAAVLAKKKGLDVFVSENGKIKEKYKKVLCKYDIKWEQGKHSDELILDADEVVKSPGIPDDVDIVEKVKKKGIGIISEIEFAGRFIRHNRTKIIGVTGSNGKTTTVLLIHHILKKAGLNVALAGNIGHSFARQVAGNECDYCVLELSSFQLDGMYDFKVDIAVLLNITPDHLDRYNKEMRRYIDSKFRITQNLTANESFIYCADDEVITKELSKRNIKAKLFPFSLKQQIKQGAYLTHPLLQLDSRIMDETELIININQIQTKMYLQELALQGKHNIYNTMAAGIVARNFDIRNEIIRDSFSDFTGIEHRLEYVVAVHGIDFINDSKATNVNSTWYALESMKKPVIWITGGVDKGNDYSILMDLVMKKVKAIICIGEDEKSNRKLHRTFSDVVDNIIDAGSMEEVAKIAYNIGENGDVVLLSPACASFDRFENFEDRGWQFKKAVREL